MCGSIVRSPLALVKVLQEIRLSLVFDFFVKAKANVALNMAFAHWCNLVKDNASPNVTVLYAVETIITGSYKIIDVLSYSDFAISPPVSSYLHFGLLWTCKLPKSMQSNNKRHISAVLAIETHRLHVGFSY